MIRKLSENKEGGLESANPQCSTCLNRWLGKLTIAPAKWYCRQGEIKDVKLIGEGTQEDLMKDNGCMKYKNSLNND